MMYIVYVFAVIGVISVYRWFKRELPPPGPSIFSKPLFPAGSYG